MFVFCGSQLFMHIRLTASSMNSCSYYALEVTAESMRAFPQTRILAR